MPAEEPPQPDPVNPDAEPPPPGTEVSEAGPLRLPQLPAILPRMPKLNLVSTIVLLGFTVLAMAFFPLVLNLERYRHAVEEKASLAAGFPVRMKHLSLDFTRGLGVRAQSVSLFSTDGRRTLARAGAITIAFDAGDLINRKFTPRVLRIDAPYVIFRHRDGHWYLDGLDRPLDAGGPGDLKELSATLERVLGELTVRELEINGGLVRTALTGGQTVSFRKINLMVENVALGSPVSASAQASIYVDSQFTGDADALFTTILPASHLDIETLPANASFKLRSLQLPQIPPLKSAGVLTGSGSVDLSVGGTLDDIHGTAALDLENFTADMQYVFRERMTPGTVGGKIGFAWDGRYLRAESFGIDIGPTDVTYFRWLSDFKPPNPHHLHEMDVEFHIRDVDLEKEFNHIPWQIIGPQVTAYCNSHIRRKGRAAYYRNFLPMYITRSLNGGSEVWLDFSRFWIDTEVNGLEMNVLPEDRLKFSNISGRFYIGNGDFVFDRLTGTVDDTLDVSVTGGFRQIDRQAKLHLDLTGEFPYPALLKLLPNYGFRAVQKVVAPLSGGQGTLSGKASVDYDINKDVYSYGGELNLSGGNLELANYPVALSGLSGPIRFTHESLDLGPITGKFGTGDLSVRMAVSDPNGTSPAFDLKVAGESLALDQILPSSSRLKGKGTVSGNYTTSGRMSGTAGSLKRTAFLRTKGVELRTPDMKLPVRDLDCTLKYATGERSSFSCGVSYGESIARVSAGFLDTPQGPRGDFSVDASNLNIDDITAAFEGARAGAAAKKKPAEVSIIEPPLPDIDDAWKRGRYSGVLTVNQGVFQRAPFEEFSAQAALGGGAFRFSTVSFAGPGGRYDLGEIGLEPRPDGSRKLHLEPKIDGVWLKPMLEAFRTPTDFVDGQLSLKGDLDVVLSDKAEFCRSVEGKLAVRLENGRISKDYRAFGQLASLINLSLNRYPQGIPFKVIQSDLTVAGGTARGTGFLLDTGDFDMKSEAIEVRLCDKWVKSNATVSVFRREFFSRLPVDIGKILRIPIVIDQSFVDRG